MQHPVLPESPTLHDIQAYVEAMGKERGFDKDTAQDKLLLLCEEVGELARAIRKNSGIKTAADSGDYKTPHEAADVLWVLLCLCNRLNIDLEQALREKEEHNKQRTWQ